MLLMSFVQHTHLSELDNLEKTNLGLEQTRPFSESTMVVDRTGGGFDSRRANAGEAGLAAQSTVRRT